MIDEFYWAGVALSVVGGFQLLKQDIRGRLQAAYARGWHDGSREAAHALGTHAGAEAFRAGGERPFAMDQVELSRRLADSRSEECREHWRLLYAYELAEQDGWLLEGQSESADADVAYEAELWLRSMGEAA